jgi:hypothetical protein
MFFCLQEKDSKIDKISTKSMIPTLEFSRQNKLTSPKENGGDAGVSRRVPMSKPRFT